MINLHCFPLGYSLLPTMRTSYFEMVSPALKSAQRSHTDRNFSIAVQSASEILVGQ